MILAATPKPRAVLTDFPIGSSFSCPEVGSVVSVREGGGAMAAPAPAVHKNTAKPIDYYACHENFTR